MKNKALLLLGFMALSLSACAPKSSGNNGGNGGNGGNEGGEENAYAQVLKDCGAQIMQAGAAQQTSAKRGFAPGTPYASTLAMPGVYLYWAGLLDEIEDVTVVDHAIHFAGTYRFSGAYNQDITFDLSVHFDEENNKFTFLGKQDVPPMAGYDHSYLVLTCDYNFTTKVFGGFTILMQPNTYNAGNYMRYTIATQLYEEFNWSSTNPAFDDQDPDYVEYFAIAQAGITELESQIASETVLEGAKLQAAKLAFKSASDYCDQVANTGFTVEIVEAD